MAAQGSIVPARSKDILNHIRRVIHQLGLIQIDYVNVLVPAHYQVLFSRLGPYEVAARRLVYDREFTEQWAHEASIVPIESWRQLLEYRRAEHRVRPWGFETFLNSNPLYVAAAVEQIRERGALTAEDLPSPEGAPKRVPETWYRSVPRSVLEAHFGRGTLAVADRKPNFARAFDLVERLIPAQYLEIRHEREAAQRELIRLAAHAYGVASAADLADYYRMPIREARQAVAELVECRELSEVRVEGWRNIAYMARGVRLPKRISAVSLISPFDPLVWYRPRGQDLFEFDYRIEIFVPKAERRWGYYVLPFLLGDRLVARVDLKADRKAARLVVLGAGIELHPDSDAEPTRWPVSYAR